MLIGYMRVSKSDGSQNLNPQKDALLHAGVKERNIFQDYGSGKHANLPGLKACLEVLRSGDTLMVWQLDRLNRNMYELVRMIKDLEERGIFLKTLMGGLTNVDTTTPLGNLLVGVLATISHFERSLIAERVKCGLKEARSRGRVGGNRYIITPEKLILIKAQAENNGQMKTMNQICYEQGLKQSAVCAYITRKGILKEKGKKFLKEMSSYKETAP